MTRYLWTRGCYSYPSVDCDALNIKPEHLAKQITTTDLYYNGKKPITTAEAKPVILFAGEGVSSHYWSMAHGAYMSGEDQANVILNYLKKI